MGDTPSVKSAETEGHRQLLTTVVILIRSDFRSLFGMEFTNQCGHFVDRYLSREVHSFADWPIYPKGNRVLDGHMDQVYCAVISTDGYLLFTGSPDQTIIAWDLLNSQMIRQWKVDRSSVWSLAYSAGSLFSGSWSGLIHIWDGGDFTLIRTLKGHTQGVIFLKLNPEGDTLISSACDNTVRMWGVNKGQCLRVFEGHTTHVYAARLVGEVVISAATDATVRIWDPTGKRECRVIRDPIPGAVNDLCINSDTSLMACLCGESFSVFEWPSMEQVCCVQASSHYGDFHPSRSDCLAVANRDDKSLRLYHARNGEVIRTLKGHSANIRDVCFSPDGLLLVSVSEDRSIRLWDISDL